MSVEAAEVAMENEYPDAPDDVLLETSSQETKRKVRGYAHSHWLLLCVVCVGSSVIL